MQNKRFIITSELAPNAKLKLMLIQTLFEEQNYNYKSRILF